MKFFILIWLHFSTDIQWLLLWMRVVSVSMTVVTSWLQKSKGRFSENSFEECLVGHSRLLDQFLFLTKIEAAACVVFLGASRWLDWQSAPESFLCIGVCACLCADNSCCSVGTDAKVPRLAAGLMISVKCNNHLYNFWGEDLISECGLHAAEIWAICQFFFLFCFLYKRPKVGEICRGFQVQDADQCDFPLSASLFWAVTVDSLLRLLFPRAASQQPPHKWMIQMILRASVCC